MKLKVSILTIVALVMVFSLTAFAGRQGGPGRRQENVRANCTDRYTVIFNGGDPARIEAWSSNNEDIDIRVYDSDGVLIVSDILPDNHPVCLWTPPHTASYIIRLTNCADHSVDYVIASN